MVRAAENMIHRDGLMNFSGPRGLGGITDDAAQALSLAEQRIKGTLTGVVLGVVLSAAAVVFFFPEVRALHSGARLLMGARRR